MRRWTRELRVNENEPRLATRYHRIVHMLAGTQIGAYRVLERIGAGGMGAVWLAEHLALGRRAAVKVLHPEYSAKPEIVQRFFNEARAATAISDPGIVQVFDFGQHTDGSAYLVMELLEGETLEKRLTSLGRLAIADALRVMHQVASTLGAAHARGIVHRDLKPENIFLVRDSAVLGGERAKILDFGIAKLASNAGGLKTSTQAVMGTPMYMSPEQCRGAGHVDQRSDVYSLGCVLFHLLTGRPLFDAEGVGDIMAMHLREPAPRLSTRTTEMPPEVDDLVARCLEKDPTRRPGSGSDLASQIAGLLDGRYASAPPRGLPPALIAGPPIAAQTTLSAATAGSIGRNTRRRAATGLLGGLGLLGVVVGALLVMWVHGRPEDEHEPASASADPTQAPRTLPGSAPAAVAPDAPQLRAPPLHESRPGDDPLAVTRKRIAGLLTDFVAWSSTHAGEPCPSAEHLAVGSALDDGWGHAMAVTCTDQPDNQIAGVRSAGPDGEMRTADDVASWTLGPEVASLAQGVRWRPTPPSRRKSPSSPRPAEPAAIPTKTTAPENTGMPTQPLANQVEHADTPTSSVATASTPAAKPSADPPVLLPTATPATTPMTGTPPPEPLTDTLDAKMISTAMEALRTRLAPCGDAYPRAKIKVIVSVQPNGSVDSVTVKDSPDDWLARCVSQRVKAAKLPGTRKGARFTYPFSFEQ